MRILVTGGTGFIGRYLVAALDAAGHEVVLAVRDVKRAALMFPNARAIPCDMNRDTRAEDWTPRLQGVQAVVNCAGVLQSGRGRDMDAIHRRAPIALFQACLSAGIKRVVQISALGAGAEAGTAYAASKDAADRALLDMPLDAVVLRPSLAYTPSGSYGGTSLFRALASCPLVLPVPGKGQQLFQPIAMDDLAAAVRHLVETPQPKARLVPAVGPERIALGDLLAAWRQWLGYREVRRLTLPEPLMALACRIGDLLSDGPVSTTAWRMMQRPNTAPVSDFFAATGVEPRPMREVFAAAPSHAQDRWHARLTLFRPLLCGLLALVWIASGIAALFNVDTAVATLEARGVSSALATPLTWAGALWDLLLGGALLAGLRRRIVLRAMLVTLAAYALGLAIVLPATWTSWLLPASLLLPFMAVTAVQLLLENDR